MVINLKNVGTIARCVFTFPFCKRRRFLWTLAVLCVYFTTRKLLTKTTDVNSLTDINKCPACFGKNLCHDFKTQKIELIEESKWSYSRFFNLKNIYWATFESRKVVLKKLGYDSELKKLDEEICKIAFNFKDCSVSEGIISLVGKREILNLFSKYDEKITDIMRCPSRRLIEEIKKKFEEKTTSDVEKNSYLSTILLHNEEPIILQLFSSRDGFPFPKYFGSCGRVVVEEFIGSSLVYQENKPWQIRLDYSLQIVRMAQILTNTAFGFHLYMTDPSIDNFAVNEDGKVFLVDTEDIIVVDYQSIVNDEWHENKSINDDYLVFSAEDLCESKISDHNYYVICKGFLSPDCWANNLMPGCLLHDVPLKVMEKWNLTNLISECVNPTEKFGRFQVISILEKALLNATLDNPL